MVKYPSGDPAAKGVLARLDPTLKPAQETRLRVVKEDLTVRFVPESDGLTFTAAMPPLVEVTAAYTIENPTGEEVQVDFGFPILRGIYLVRGMVDVPGRPRDALTRNVLRPTMISNSAIYGMIRQNARKVIEKGIAADAELARLTAAVRAAWIAPRPAAAARAVGCTAGSAPRSGPSGQPTADYLPARENLRTYLTADLHWNDRDAALLVEYASLDCGASRTSGAVPAARPLGLPRHFRNATENSTN